MVVVITGASGQLGRLVAELVLDRVEPEQLILVTRHVDELEDFTARGAVVRPGDFDDPALLESAFAGGERLLLVSTDALGERVRQHANAIDAAVAAGIGAVAYTSLVNPSDSNPAAVAEEHRATEELLRASGLDWTFLRNSIYAEMLVPAAAAALASGELVTNAGDGRTGYVSRADCAAAAAVVLTATGHELRAYDITGPEALGARELAALYAEVGGRAVAPVLVGDDELVARIVRDTGVPEAVARMFATFGTATRRGYLAPVSTTVRELTGRDPLPLRAVLQAARAALADLPVAAGDDGAA